MAFKIKKKNDLYNFKKYSCYQLCFRNKSRRCPKFITSEKQLSHMMNIVIRFDYWYLVADL